MTGTLADRLAQLVSAFNARSLDVPDALLDRACTFRLNGVAYEDTMGRTVSDPIVRLLGRGPAAYRSLAQALRYAVPDAEVRLDPIVPEDADRAPLASTTATLKGALRGAEGRFRAKVAVALVVGDAGLVQEIAVMMSEEQLVAIREARRR
jgi:hypothetical protein